MSSYGPDDVDTKDIIRIVENVDPSARVESIKGPLPNHRHAVYRLQIQSDGHSPNTWWLKSGQAPRRASGVAHEARVLDLVRGRLAAVPTIVARSDTIESKPIDQAWFISLSLPGRPLAAHQSPFDATALHWMKNWLDHLSMCRPEAEHCAGACVRDGVFSEHPDLLALLETADATLGRSPIGARLLHRARAAAQTPTCSGVVHGSFDTRNVLVDARGNPTGVVDFEAARPGPPMLDVASMVCSLAMDISPELAKQWLHANSNSSTDERIETEVVPLCAIRLHLRIEARALTAAAFDATCQALNLRG